MNDLVAELIVEQEGLPVTGMILDVGETEILGQHDQSFRLEGLQSGYPLAHGLVDESAAPS